jgi:hypothetical protein
MKKVIAIPSELVGRIADLTTRLHNLNQVLQDTTTLIHTAAEADKQALSLTKSELELSISDTERDLISAQAEMSSFGEVELTEEERLEREQETAHHETFIKSHGYIYKRALNYPSIGDQLDVIWKTITTLHNSGVVLPQTTVDMLNAIATVKDTYRKPE